MTTAHRPPPLWRALFPLLLLAVALMLLWNLFPSTAPRAGGIVQQPLRRGSAAEGSRFVRREAAATGVAFRNELRKENTYTYLTNGAGMAVGDYDGDGLPDLYFVSQDGPNRLYRQVSPWRFEDVTQAAGNVDGGDAWGTGATFVDIDNDGDLDLYACNMEAPNRLYVNQGNGTFIEQGAARGAGFTGATTMAAFFDYDRDGDPDLYLLTNRALHPGWPLTPEVMTAMRAPRDTARPIDAMVPPRELLQDPVLNTAMRGGAAAGAVALPAGAEGHFQVLVGHVAFAGAPDQLLRNDGGRFVDVTERSGIRDRGMGLSATVWDYDGDGWPDLYVANDLESPDTLWHNNRDGTFRDVTRDVLPHTAYYGMGSDCADFDNDGLLDLIVGDMSATTHKMAKVLMGDMNAQLPFLKHLNPPQQMRNALYRNTGLGRCQEIAALCGVSSTDWTWSMLFGDLDNDGWQDLFVTNGIARFDMDPDLQLRVSKLAGSAQREAAIREIQNVRAVPERNLALRNEGGLKFSKTGAAWGLDEVAVTHGAVLVDLDRDGDIDVVHNNWNEPASLYENVGGGGRAALVTLRGQRSSRHGVGATVALTTFPDFGGQLRTCELSRGYMSGQEPVLHFGLGDAAKIATIEVRWPSGLRQSFLDLPVDHHFTITEPPGEGDRGSPRTEPTLPLVPAAAPDWRHRERDHDDFATQPLLPHRLSQLGPGLAASGDLLWCGGAAGQPGALWRREGNGWREVAGPWADDAASEDMGALFFDADGDGDDDLLVVSGGVEHQAGDAALRDRLYRNDGGTFVRDPAAMPDLRESGSTAVAGDFDGDGDLDVFVGGRAVPGMFPDAPPSRLLRNDGGRFADVTQSAAPALLQAGMVTSALFTDVDVDGKPDLLVAAHWQPLRYLHNDGGTFSDRTAAAGLGDCKGWWNGLCALDIDADGDLDYAASNQGRNSKYKASPDHPTGLYFGDFDDNGTRDLIETKYEGDRLLPVRGRSCSSQAMPFLAEKFPTYEQFASSVLTEIYPQPKLASAGQLSANCLDHVLLRNDGTGRFAIEPLPWLAQGAPGFGMTALDVSGDGCPELVLAQNFFSPEPETGRMDGGVGVMVNGGTELGALRPNATGLLAPGDCKGLVLLANGESPQLAFSRNADRPLLFAVRTPQLAVTLIGTPQNPRGIGARVTAVLADGRRCTAELHAGGSYLSQGDPTVWFGGEVREVEVRWPDGRLATHRVVGAPRGVQLKAP